MAADLKQISDNPRPVKTISGEILARSRQPVGFRTNPFTAPSFPPAVVKAMEADKVPTLAQDDMISGTMGWAAADQVVAAYNEGLVFLGYSYLAVLSQRPEYRVVSEVISTEMTREWIELKVGSGDESKNDKIKFLEDELDRLSIRDAFRKVTEGDGFFGRGHLYLDTGRTADADELKLDIGNGRNQLSKLKIGPDKKQKLIAVRPVEATWAYPTNYESIDPLAADWYKPRTWYVMSREIHRSRFLTFVGREVPDILKPAYAFGGLSMSQMLKPYVDNWLRTRQSVSDLIQNFSVNVLRTNMDATTSIGGEALFARVALFNNVKNNQGTMVIDKDSEDWANVSVPLGGLDSLQAQSQEHMAAIARIPLVKLLGIQPAGLNASSEGELISFEDWIAAFQELLYRGHLTTIIDLIQLSAWGKIDDEITFDFKPLRQQKPEEKANLDATIAQTREMYMQMGAVQGPEIRELLAEDPDSPFQGLDLSKQLPAPPMPGPGELGGMPGAPPSAPGGGAPMPPPGGAGGPGGAQPRLTRPGGLPPGGAPDAAPFSPQALVAALNNPEAPENDNTLAQGLVDALNVAHQQAGDAAFEESKVKRNEGGEFTSGGGGAVARATGAVKGAARATAQRAGQAIRDFSKEDLHAIREAAKPRSPERNRLREGLAAIARAMPHLARTHLREEKHKAVHAAGALRAISTGTRPTSEQWKGLRQFAISMVMSAGMFLATGDPTGSVGHVASQIGGTIVEHAMMEHGAKLGIGTIRHATGVGSGDAAPGDELSPEDVTLLQRFLEHLAEVAASFELPEEPLGETEPPDRAPAQDAQLRELHEVHVYLEAAT